MQQQETKGLEQYTATKLSHTYRKPGEWIGELTNGDRIYIVAQPRTLMVAMGPVLGDVLLTIRTGECMRIKHSAGNSEVTSEQMLEATGLRLDCDVKENCAGEIR